MAFSRESVLTGEAREAALERLSAIQQQLHDHPPFLLEDRIPLERDRDRLQYALSITGGQGNTRWDERWGHVYSPEHKDRMMGRHLRQMDAEGKIGNTLIDVGSGAYPVTQMLRYKKDRKIIAVDVAGGNHRHRDRQELRVDAEAVDRPDSLAYKKALIRSQGFLGLKPDTADSRQADSVFFSEILNYVDSGKVIEGFGRFIKPGGRVIIYNKPDYGLESLFSGDRFKDNHELLGFLTDRGFDTEHLQVVERGMDAALSKIFFVARKG